MKIAVFSPSESERKLVAATEKKFGCELKLIDELLSAENVDQVADCDGVLLKPLGNLDDEIVYKKLADYGIKSIGLRIVGTNTIDFDLAKKYHLTVTNVPVYSPRAIAEMAVTQAMYLNRKIGEFKANMDKGDFTNPDSLISNEIYNKTIGLIGVGHIGSAVAQIFSAMGAKVLAYDVIYNPEVEPYLTYADFDTVLKEADIISLHTPLLKSTENMIGKKQFAEMKNDAILINAARGELVDTAALIEALEKHEIAAAGLDTLAHESSYFFKKVDDAQIPADYKKLAAMPNVIVTPHSAYFTKTSVRNMIEISLRDTIALANGERAHFVVLW